MAQPRTAARAPTEAATARVEVQTLSSAQALNQMTNPVSIRGGRISSLTVSVPLLMERSRYLILHVPQAALSALNDHLLSLPEGQRGGFMRRYHQRLQRDMLEAYASSGVSGRRGRQRFAFQLAAPGSVRVTGGRP